MRPQKRRHTKSERARHQAHPGIDGENEAIQHASAFLRVANSPKELLLCFALSANIPVHVLTTFAFAADGIPTLPDGLCFG
jgi:hypothetical protein